MIRLRFILLILISSLAQMACATKQQPKPNSTPATQSRESKTQAPYKKPVRMNGRGDVSSISLEEMFAIQGSGNALIFDARPNFLYRISHIPGARSLPKPDCDKAIAAMDNELKAAVTAGKPIVVYCSGLLCPDARTVAMNISGFGHPAKIFSGGYDAWQKAGLPTE